LERLKQLIRRFRTATLKNWSWQGASREASQGPASDIRKLSKGQGAEKRDQCQHWLMYLTGHSSGMFVRARRWDCVAAHIISSKAQKVSKCTFHSTSQPNFGVIFRGLAVKPLQTILVCDWIKTMDYLDFNVSKTLRS
jgi:hypothetical protein